MMPHSSSRLFQFRVLSTILVILSFIVNAPVVTAMDYATTAPPLQSSEYVAVWSTLKKAKVKVDDFGFTKISADNEIDLFYALGFVHATERLFQMDLLRRTANGRVAEILGVAALNQDLLPRALGIEHAAQSAAEELASNDPETYAILQSYAKGINDYLAQTPATGLPLEFQALGYFPDPWQPADSLAIGKALALQLSTLSNELTFLQFLSAGLTPEQILALFAPNAYPFNPETRFPIIPVEEMAGLEMAAPPKPTEIAKINLESPQLGEKVAGLFGPFLRQTPDASNSWVVAGELTESGKPLLANDPHLDFSIPIIWYHTSLESPRFVAAGGSIPGVPVIAVGRNRFLSWGFTASVVDTLDFFALIRPEDIDQDPNDAFYILFENGIPTPVRFGVRLEEIKVRGEDDPVIVPVRESEFGPVVTDVLGIDRPIALNWTGTALQSDRSISALLEINRAHNWNQFLRGVQQSESVNLNLVYADLAGHIGFANMGAAPLRQLGQSGLFPVIADEASDNWSGYRDPDTLPRLRDPTQGYIVAANQPITSPEDPRFVQGQHAESYRAERITQMIQDHIDRDRQIGVEDFKAMQLDLQSLLFRDLKPLLADIEAVLEAASSQPTAALERCRSLLAWDGIMSADSPQATLFETWYNDLSGIPAQALGQDYLSGRPQMEPLPRLLLRLYAQGEPLLGMTPEIFVQTAAQLFVEAVDTLGDDIPEWGEVHHAVFAHPVLPNLSIKPGIGGNRYTVNVAVANDVPSFDVKHGVSYRQIIDVSQSDDSEFIMPLGQSERSNSPFFSNLLPLWLDGEYLPLTPLD